MKFGGASVATPERLDEVAALIEAKVKCHKKIIVVVSAMGTTTDELIGLAKKVHPQPPERELDMLVTVGERISIALLAMALHKRGVGAVSFTGSQSGIITTPNHTNAKIIDVRPHRIIRALNEGKVAIVAGFQGVSTQGEITTLGRGGSDTSAVAIAVSLDAEVEFYKDVAGIYNADPKKEKEATLFEKLNYEEAKAIIRKGAKVLHLRAIELAEKNLLPMRVLSFNTEVLEEFPGTLISGESPHLTETKYFEGPDETRISAATPSLNAL